MHGNVGLRSWGGGGWEIIFQLCPQLSVIDVTRVSSLIFIAALGNGMTITQMKKLRHKVASIIHSVSRKAGIRAWAARQKLCLSPCAISWTPLCTGHRVLGALVHPPLPGGLHVPSPSPGIVAGPASNVLNSPQSPVMGWLGFWLCLGFPKVWGQHLEAWNLAEFTCQTGKENACEQRNVPKKMGIS